MRNTRSNTGVDRLEHESGITNRIKLIQNGACNVSGSILDNLDTSPAWISYRISHILAHFTGQPLHCVTGSFTHAPAFEDVETDVLGSILGKILGRIHGDAFKHISRDRSRLILGELVGIQIHFGTQAGHVVPSSGYRSNGVPSKRPEQAPNIGWRQYRIRYVQAYAIKEKRDMQFPMAFDATARLTCDGAHDFAFLIQRYFFPTIRGAHRFDTQSFPGSSGSTLPDATPRGVLA